MRRSAILFAMLFAMLWQSLTLARVGSTVNPLADQVHAALHWLGESHHHHEDGSYHLDDSQESTQHVLIDHVGAGTALLASQSHNFLSLGFSIAHGFQGTTAPNPFLDGLLRPPRLHA